jgi:DNA-binding transcriptional LysR family regulator
MNTTLLPDLATFVLIVDQGSFSAAARVSGATPSAMSRCVSRLEQALGNKLLHRTTRKLRLSESGRSVYEHAQMMLEAARQAMNAGSSVQDIAQGTLTISVPKAVGDLLSIHSWANFLSATRRLMYGCVWKIVIWI